MRIYVGTGGYSNEDWRGIVYPENAKRSEFLRYYSLYFNAVELNVSFYVVPGRKSVEGILKNSGDLKFSVKLPSFMTHDLSASGEDYTGFLKAMEPFEEAGKLGVYLAQFPYRFKNTPENRRYIASLSEVFRDRRLAVEFRHSSWDTPDTNPWLEGMGIFRVSSDYPPLRNLPIPALHVVRGFAYVRLHGRNTEKWWRGRDQRERHDYRYSYEELALWVAAVKGKPIREIWIIFNNTTKGHAIYNICMMKKLWPDLPTTVERVVRC